MGFLDAFLNQNDPQSQGLLAAAAQMLQQSGPSLMPHSFGQVLGSGMNAYQQTSQQAQQHQLDQMLRGLQLQEAQGKLSDSSRERTLQNQINDAARASMRTPEQQAASLPGGPTIANAAQIPNMKGGFDADSFINQVMAIDPMKGLALAQTLKKTGPKFDTKINYVTGPDGKPMAIMAAEDGSIRKLDGVLPRDELKLANLGGKDVAYNPFDLQPGQAFQRTMTPGEQATNGIARERLSFDKSQVGKPIFNAEAGGFITPPSALAPNGGITPLAGFTKPEKPPTEFQGKSSAFALRATEADKILNSLNGKYSPAAINSKQAVENTWLVGGPLGAATNALAMSSSDQRAEQAQRDFVNAVLRQESGAAIGQSEFENAKRQYFPQPGDGEAVISQKARNRALAVQALTANAGRAALTAPPVAGGTGGWSIEKVN